MSYKAFAGFAAAFALSAAMIGAPPAEAAVSERPALEVGRCKRNDGVDNTTARVQFEQCVESRREQSRMGLFVFLTAIGITGGAFVYACKS